MLATQRHQQILSLLDNKGTMRTVDLADTFHVTHETIRRDLLSLSDEGLLTRIHGGACSLSGRPKLRSFDERSELNMAQKQAIARAAVELVEPGKTYAFDSSTTVISMVNLLPELPYRVVSNAFAVFDRMQYLEKVDLICMGGRYHPKTRTFISGHSTEALRRYHLHKAFVSCVGFNFESGASESFEEQATYKEALAQHADEVVLLIDSSKFREQSEYYFAPIDTIDHIITDSGIGDKDADRIRALGIQLTVVEVN